MGPGNFSTAIIELPNGEVKNIEVSLIEFIEKKQNHQALNRNAFLDSI